MTIDLREVLGVEETPWLEFKQQITNRETLGKAICALANDLAGHGSGDLIIGVADGGVPFGADVSDQALLNIAQIRNEGNILPLPSMVVTSESFSGSPSIRVHVNPSVNGPVRYKGVCWVRPGPLTKEASADDERVLIERQRSHLVPPDLRQVGSTKLEDLDRDLIESTIIPAFVAPEVLEENGRPLDQQMAALNIIGEDAVPTVLGVLVAGFDPSAHIPGAYIQFVRYDGPDEGASIADEDEIRENLTTALRLLTKLLDINIRHRVKSSDLLTEIKAPDYPPAALREIVMNAIVHRTYDGSNAPTRVLWFSDRVEVSSPGGPYGTVTNDNFAKTTDYRNPNLAAAMKNLGYLNRFGRGISRTTALMQANGNPPPEYDIGRSWWTVTLKRAR